MPQNDSLEEQLSSAVRELERAEADLAYAQRDVALARERVRALQRVLELQEASPSQPLPDVVDATVALISEQGRPMRLSEIREALLSRGIALPGRGTDANLFGRLNRSGGRITRVNRGLYDVTPDD